MADLSQTPANVKPIGAEPTCEYVQFGEAVTQGNVVYLNTTANTWSKADADNTDATAGEDGLGIVLTPAASSGYGWIQRAGDIDVGATLTVGADYYVSPTAGAIETTVASGDRKSTLGIATAAGSLKLKPLYSGATVP